MSDDATGYGEDVLPAEASINRAHVSGGIDASPFPEADHAGGARSHETWPYSASGEPCHAA